VTAARGRTQLAGLLAAVGVARGGLLRRIGGDHVYTSVDEAVTAARAVPSAS
jgi:hypothetical protein